MKIYEPGFAISICDHLHTLRTTLRLGISVEWLGPVLQDKVMFEQVQDQVSWCAFH